MQVRSQLLVNFNILPSLNITVVERDKLFVQTPSPLVEVWPVGTLP